MVRVWIWENRLCRANCRGKRAACIVPGFRSRNGCRYRKARYFQLVQPLNHATFSVNDSV